jgi:hypothetical protein
MAPAMVNTTDENISQPDRFIVLCLSVALLLTIPAQWWRKTAAA